MDILLKGKGTECDDGYMVVYFLDDAGCVQSVHLRHADIHQNQVGMLVVVQGHGINAIVCAYQSVTSAQDILDKLVVAFFVFCHQYGFLVLALGAQGDAQGAAVVSQAAGAFAFFANGTLEGKNKGEGSTPASFAFDSDVASQLPSANLAQRQPHPVSVLGLGIFGNVCEEDVVDVFLGNAMTGI